MWIVLIFFGYLFFTGKLKKIVKFCKKTIESSKKIFSVCILGGLFVLGFYAIVKFNEVAFAILGIIFILYIYIRLNNRWKIRRWNKQNSNETTWNDIDNIMIKLVEDFAFFDENHENYKFDIYTLPYGRVEAFLNYFNNSIFQDEVYYFSATKSLDKNQIREYGTMITRTGIYISNQIKTKDRNNPYKIVDKFIPFEGLYAVNNTDKEMRYSVINTQKKVIRIKKIQNDETTLSNERIQLFCNDIIQLKIPHQYANNKIINQETIEDSVEEAEGKFKNKIDLEGMEGVVSTAGIAGSFGDMKQSFNETKNYMNATKGGGGYASEYGNNTIDKAMGKNVQNEAQNLDPETGRQIKNGADRIVDGIKYQTKYYQSASETIGSVFEKGKSIYNDNGKMMAIEVPKDQYQESLKLMKKRIERGEVQGAKLGDNPEKYVKKGHFTYLQANNIAISGTVESLAVDVINGAVICVQAGGISAVIAFSMAVWQGQSVKEAAKVGVSTGLKVLGRGTFIYTLAMQLSRDKLVNPFTSHILTAQGKTKSVGYITSPVFKASENLAKKISNSAIANTGMGQALGLKEVSGKVVIGTGVTAMVVFGPDICRVLSGRISFKQLLKNSTISGSSIGGGVIGGILIPIPIVGTIIGGAIGGSAAKKVLDRFIEDDAEWMFQILKEEFLDIVILSNLDKEEFEKVVSMSICHPKLISLLKDMYASGEYRYFARKTIITAAVTDVLSERNTIKDEDIYKGYNLLLETA